MRPTGPHPQTYAPPTGVVDALGREIRLGATPARIVSLVPSLTEALCAFGLRAEIVGITTYCVEPAALVADVPKVGGTKTPELAAVEQLAPDLVIASAEENVRDHIERLIGHGLTVYVSRPDTVRRALNELRDLALLTGCERSAAAWLAPAQRLLEELVRRHASARPVRYFCPIWRRPYMAAGPNTYMSDLLRVCGGENVCGAGPARYYPVDLDEVLARGPALVLLPSEPYPFTEKHRAEILAHRRSGAPSADRVILVDGKLVTWYGPRIGTALETFAHLFHKIAGDTA